MQNPYHVRKLYWISNRQVFMGVMLTMAGRFFVANATNCDVVAKVVRSVGGIQAETSLSLLGMNTRSIRLVHTGR